MVKKVRSALISVYHKTGLEVMVKVLIEQKVQIYSTGGTAEYLRNLGAEVHEVADLTDYPSILGGRVKTLHPKVFGGILARQEDESHIADLKQYDIPFLDLVVVDLYPFEETVAAGGSEAEVIEKIDIGGISLIRAAAKNFRDVAIVPSQEYYEQAAEWLADQEGGFTLEQRKNLAGEAFDISSHYDAHIYRYLAGEPTSLKVSEREHTSLRYGENPHQEARFHGDLEDMFEQLNGKPLSYNNLVDIDAAVHLIDDFEGETAFAVLKHTNPCGLAVRDSVVEAWKAALAGDPVSAFGGILITNGELDLATAKEMKSLFFEVLIAPAYTEDALAELKKKKKAILLKRLEVDMPKTTIKTILKGIIEQDKDSHFIPQAEWEYKTTRKPSEKEAGDIIFGEKVVKHLKSNAIALVKDGQLIGSGLGQTSRIDALKQCIAKAQEKGFEPAGGVLASDAFFPFSDSAEIAYQHGIEVIVEPGGSIRDDDTINFCEANKMCLVFTKVRHFKH